VATPTALMHKTHSLTPKREVELRLSRVVESSVATLHGLRARRKRGCPRRFGIVPFVRLLQLALLGRDVTTVVSRCGQLESDHCVIVQRW